MTGWPYPLPAGDGGASHLKPGLRLPLVSLRATVGGDVDLWARPGPSVLFVYPWTGRPGYPNPPNWDAIPGAHGSTPEAEGFRDLHSEFDGRGVSIFGLSGQSAEEQAEFASRVRLPFALLSDAGFTFANALDLPRFETGGVTYLKRLTLILRDGAVEGIFHPVPDPASHPDEVLAALRS